VSNLQDRLESFAARTEANLDATMTWLKDRQGEYAQTDSTLLKVSYNSAMMAIGIAAALHFSAAWIVALAVAWTVFHAYPIGLAAWRAVL